jgi:2-oxoglutarate ferredoxin oxidoreductase subunit alpha
VFIASNKEIGMTRETLDLDSLDKPPVIDRTIHEAGAFLPFGVKGAVEVPRFLPIGGAVPVRQTSSTHGPDGYITTDPLEIQAGVERLQRKIETYIQSFSFHQFDRYGDSRLLLVVYGVTARAAKVAVSELSREGIPVSLLVLKTLWPVPEEVIRRSADEADSILVAEMNLGQYVHEIRRVLCEKPVSFYGKMNGRLISPAEIMRKVKELLSGQSA